MSIVTTGLSGFVGEAFARQLVGQVQDKVINLGRRHVSIPGVSSYLCDLADENWVREFFKKEKPHTIYHFAGNPLVKSTPDDHLRSNFLSTFNLLKWCPNEVRFVYASTITVYGNCIKPMSEKDLCNPTSVYASMKLASENLIQSYVELKGIKPLIVRLGATVGQNSTHGLLHDIINKLKNQKTLQLLGKPPGSYKPYTHINDVVQGILSLQSGTFNLCNEDVLSVVEVAKIAMELLGKKKIEWLDQNWVGDNSKLQIDCSSLKKFYTIQLSSAQAISQVVSDSIQSS